jgi:hypothetical protein
MDYSGGGTISTGDLDRRVNVSWKGPRFGYEPGSLDRDVEDIIFCLESWDRIEKEGI